MTTPTVLLLGGGSSRPVALVLGAVMFLFLGARVSRLEANPPSRAVATESALSTREALAVLASGGSAVDAAVVAALVGGVTAPTSSGLGGGGFALVWDAQARMPRVFDFRETAPQRLEAEVFERRPLAEAETGHLVGVPGELLGLWTLHGRFGKLPWSALVKRAAHRARSGFPVSPHLGAMLPYGQKKLAQNPALAALYFPGGRAAVVGTRLTNPALARSLDTIASQGPKSFYEGPLGAAFVAEARAHGSPLSALDLERYRVIEREALHLRYEGKDVWTMPPPSAGGLMVIEVLSLLSGDELRRLGLGSPAYQHLLAEAMRGAIADRLRFVGDPDFETVDVARLVGPQRMAARKELLSIDRTHALPRFGLEEHGTHHLVVADRDGNVVSLTTTLNRLFGSALGGGSTGIVLNDELDDFTPRAAVRAFGMQESPNRPRPGARPVSSMTPTLVSQGGEVLLALGGSGGMAIAPNVVQVLLSALVFDRAPLDAVSAPRIYLPTNGATLLVERGTSEEHKADLAFRGEIVEENRMTFSAVQLIDRRGPVPQAAADPRKHGEAAAP